MNNDWKITFEKFRNSNSYKEFETALEYYREWTKLEDLINDERCNQPFIDYSLIKRASDQIRDLNKKIKQDQLYELRNNLEETKQKVWKYFIQLFAEKFYEIGFRSKHCISMLFYPDKCTFKNLETLVLKHAESSTNQTENLISL